MVHLSPVKIDKHIYLKSTESTNLFAQNYLSNFNPEHNICIYSHNQTRGRGQIGRFWYSSANLNLSLSYIVRIIIPAKNHFSINMAFSLAIYDFLTSLLKDQKLKIKWPNDLYVDDTKIGGILIQNTIRGNQLQSSILGVGINVGQQVFPPDLPNPVSIYQLTARKMELLPLQMMLHPYVEKRLSQLQLNSNTLAADYNAALYRLNEPAFFETEGTRFQGTIIEVNYEGKLRMRTDSEIREFNFRELKYIL